jgi:hypothetical protein
MQILFTLNLLKAGVYLKILFLVDKFSTDCIAF